jgi:hypothetical protein
MTNGTGSLEGLLKARQQLDLGKERVLGELRKKLKLLGYDVVPRGRVGERAVALPSNRVGGIRADGKLIERMRRLRAEGMSNMAIAEELGIAKSTVERNIGSQPRAMTLANRAAGQLRRAATLRRAAKR